MKTRMYMTSKDINSANVAYLKKIDVVLYYVQLL